MSPATDTVTQQILTLDFSGAFAQRLAKENGWSASYSARVIHEYKRFLILAARSGHDITPSQAVDEAWHLHLIHTRSYWNDFCRNILGRPLHHNPATGAPDEGQMFAVAYVDTLKAYRQHFREEPPADIWPTPSRNIAMPAGRKGFHLKKVVAIVLFSSALLIGCNVTDADLGNLFIGAFCGLVLLLVVLKLMGVGGPRKCSGGSCGGAGSSCSGVYGGTGHEIDGGRGGDGNACSGGGDGGSSCSGGSSCGGGCGGGGD